MSIWQHILNAFRTFASNKLRAALSSLGIIIGILSVVVLLAIGEGAQRAIVSNIESLGSNLLTLTPGGSRQSDVRSKTSGKQRTDILTESTISLLSELGGIKDISPEITTRKQIIYEDKNMSVNIYGVLPVYAKVKNTELAFGEFISQEQVDASDNVAVLGSNTATTLFGEGVNPLGKIVQAGGIVFRVIGVTKSKGTQGIQSTVDTLYVPVSVVMDRITGQRYYSSISIVTETAEDLTPTVTRIQKVLDAQLGVTNISERPYNIQNQADILSSISQITTTFKLFLGAVAAISLLVGGIGVMNIMLVSVTERTREIGIRKAIGAQKSEIILQFLMESLILCLFGGFIAISLSYLIIFAISSIIQGVITPNTLMLAFGFASGIGIGFGIFPAYKAASLKPIDALRFE